MFYIRFITSDPWFVSEIPGRVTIFFQQVWFLTFFSFFKLSQFLSLLSLSWCRCLLFIWEYVIFVIFPWPSWDQLNHNDQLNNDLLIFVFTFYPVAMEEVSFVLPRVALPRGLTISSTLVQGPYSLCHLLSLVRFSSSVASEYKNGLLHLVLKKPSLDSIFLSS